MLLMPVMLEAAVLEGRTAWMSDAEVQYPEIEDAVIERFSASREKAPLTDAWTLQELYIQEEVEPNDTRSQANLMDNDRLYSGNYALVGWIDDHPGDVDYFRFQVQHGGLVFLPAMWVGNYYQAGWEGDLFLTLYDSTGNELFTQSVDGSGADMFCYIFAYINAGTYYLKVSASQAVGYTYVGEPYAVYPEVFPDVYIPDSNLQAGLRSALDIEGRNVTELDLWFAEYLDIANLGIRNLTGMEYAVNLKQLSVYGNQITNLTPLAQLTGLEYLNVSANPGLANLSALDTLANLMVLEVHGTSVADVSIIHQLPALVSLAVGGDWLRDLSPVAGKPDLKALVILDAPLIHELGFLAGLNELEFLVIEGTLVTDITPVTGLGELWNLDLINNRITDISALSTMASGLVSLSLRGNEIQDIGPLLDFHAQGALSENSLLDLRYNDLDLTPGGPAVTVIDVLKAHEVEVFYEPQQWVDRIAGANRYRTAIEVSRAGWLQGADTVVLARGDNFADALAGVPLAYLLDAPILLTSPTRIGATTLAEIERLGADRVIILGGTAAVSDGVAAELTGRGLTVERIAGSGRYQTAVLIAEAMAAAGADFSSAVMAVGTNFPDALAAASYAAMAGQPILLTASTYLPGSTRDAVDEMGITDLLIVGGTGVINADVEGELAAYGTVMRVFGSNRYTTAIAITQHFDPKTDRFYVATGTDFPDAISGAVLAAKRGTGVLLVYGVGSQPNESVRDFFTARDVRYVNFFGGASVISTGIEDWFWTYMD